MRQGATRKEKGRGTRGEYKEKKRDKKKVRLRTKETARIENKKDKMMQRQDLRQVEDMVRHEKRQENKER